MSTPKSISGDEPISRPADFSLVLGGPLYQLWRGTRLADDTLQLLHRRVLVAVLLTWVPLLVLAIAEGRAGAQQSRCRCSTTWSCTSGCCSRCRC